MDGFAWEHSFARLEMKRAGRDAGNYTYEELYQKVMRIAFPGKADGEMGV